MKGLIKFTGITVLILPLLVAGTLFLVIEDVALLHDKAIMTPERIARGKKVFQLNDPRRLHHGEIGQVILNQEDIDLAINYFANQFADAVAGLSIDQGQAVIESTFTLPDNPLGRFLNLKITLKQTDNIPQIDQLWLGKLWIPGIVADSVVKNNLNSVQPSVDWQKLYDMIRRVRFEKRQMTVTYQWQNNMAAKLSGLFLSPQDQDRLQTYQARLAELTQDGYTNLPLTELMQPMFQLALERSLNGDAVAENRAVILVLTFYANQKTIYKFLPLPKSVKYPHWRFVTLQDRDDFAKHYLVSAMLAAYAGTPLADAVGVFKELEDSRGGSGFSFNDLAADLAGTRMGELAIQNQ